MKTRLPPNGPALTRTRLRSSPDRCREMGVATRPVASGAQRIPRHRLETNSLTLGLGIGNERELNEKHRRIQLYTGERLDERIPVVESVDDITLVGAGGDAGPFASVIGAWGDVISITKRVNT